MQQFSIGVSVYKLAGRLSPDFAGRCGNDFGEMHGLSSSSYYTVPSAALQEIPKSRFGIAEVKATATAVVFRASSQTQLRTLLLLAVLVMIYM